MSIRGAFTPHEFRNLDKEKAWRLLEKGLAEMFGTGLFVCMGCMGTLSDSKGEYLDYLGGVLTFAFAIATSVMIFGHISCIINPALVAADVIRGEKSLFMFVYITVMECLGAFLGYALLRVLVADDLLGGTSGSFCCTAKDVRVTSLRAMGVEMLITAILCLLFCSVQDPKNSDRNSTVALKFGFGCFALLLPSVHYASSSMNPARSFGPALYNNHWKDQWIYWVGPMSGAIISAVIYMLLFAQHFPRSKREIRPNSHI
nr:PREDICTED: aquaporin AQPAe.a-like [Bemisia tabaci]